MQGKSLRIIAIGSILWCGLAVSLRSEQVDVPSDSIRYHLDPVVVIASRLAAAQSQAAASVSVIDAGMMQHMEAHSALQAVSDFVPGVFITEKAVMGYGVASGAAGGISIRGVGGSPVTGVLVLRDGRPDMMGLMGHPLPDSYPLQGLERIEVIRGPASFLYGTNAMGGVINLVSKRPDTPGMHSRISASTGSYASRNLTLSHGGKFSRLQYMLTAASSRTDGHRPFSQYEGDHFNLHTSYQLSEGSRIEMNGNYADLYLYDPGTVTAPFSDHWYDLVRYGADLSWSHQSQAGDSHLQLHGNFGRHRIYDGFRSHDHTVGVLIYHHAKPWRGATATLGYDWRQYGGEAQNVLKTLDYGEHAVDQSGAYLHLQQLMWRRWLVSAGVRYENPYHQWLPKFGLVWHTMPQLSWRISATKGFRSPTIRELYLFPAPTPDLKPEIMWNYEMGGTYLITANLKLDAAVFRSEGSDLIRQLGQWPNIKLVNSSQFVHSGFELTGEWRLWQNLHTGLSYSWIDVGDQTLNTPGKKWNLFANYQWHRFQVYARVMHVQDLYGADNRQNPLSDYLILDGAVTCRFWDGLSLRLGGKNLNDADYQTMYGYPMPGRTLEAQVRFAF